MLSEFTPFSTRTAPFWQLWVLSGQFNSSSPLSAVPFTSVRSPINLIDPAKLRRRLTPDLHPLSCPIKARSGLRCWTKARLGRHLLGRPYFTLHRLCECAVPTQPLRIFGAHLSSLVLSRAPSLHQVARGQAAEHLEVDAP